MPRPSANNIKKNRNEKRGLIGMCVIASGYVMNAKPGPEEPAYFSTDSPSSDARYPIVANTAKPAKIPVKQSHDTTIHICLNRYVVKRFFDEEGGHLLKEVVLKLVGC